MATANIAVDPVVPASEAQLAEVNSRLKKGEGYIGYLKPGTPKQSKYLYMMFYAGTKQKQLNTGTNNPEEAYRQLLDARTQTVKHGARLLPQEVSRIRYEYLIELLMQDWHERSTASIRTRKTEDGQDEETFAGKCNLDAFFARVPITEITALRISDYTAHRRKQGAADSTIRRELNNLSAAFTVAEKKEVITANNVPRFTLPKDSEPREGFMEAKEFGKFLAKFPSNLQATVLFLYYTGCRHGAAEEITWSMVNADCTEIHAPGRIIKIRKPWEIPLVGPLQPISDALKKIRKSGIQAAEKHVFDFTNFRKVWCQICFDSNLATVWDKATQRYTGLRPHDFRRSAARNLSKAGVSEQVGMKITGHKTPAMYRRYNITNGDDVRDALMQVGKKSKVQSISGGK